MRLFGQIFLAPRFDFAYYSSVSIGSRIVALNQEKKSMLKRILMVGVALCAAFVLSAIAFAQEPRVTVGERHGNMRAAQQLIQQAWQKVDEAQKDNNYNLGGHAGRAKELLAQASEEIKLSAEAANSHH
jgi:mannitol-specific phosphotransferase system IIBC component